MVDNGIAIGGTYSNDGDVIGLDGDADGWVLQLDVATGAGEVHGIKGDITVYPNPVSNILKVKLKGLEKRNFVAVTNIIGQVIYSAVTTNDQLEIDLRKWKPGYYLFSASSADTKSPQIVKAFQIIR
jgi:hypothetical protein